MNAQPSSGAQNGMMYICTAVRPADPFSCAQNTKPITAVVWIARQFQSTPNTRLR